jgi:NADPH:quinone reductase-like Zn-dependent oxidoreductase
MKSWLIDGGSGELACKDVAAPEPGADEILVRMHTAGLNRGEFIRGHGLHQPGVMKPAGMEGAGEIVKVGSGVTGFKAGDAVMGRPMGAFSEMANWKAAESILKPAGLTWEEAAGASLAYWVAYDMVVRSASGTANDDAGMVGAGDWILVTGVSSGVGVASMQIAKARGARVIGTSGSQAKLDRLATLGLDVGVCVRGPGFVDAVMKATDGKGVKLLVNNVGGGVFEDGMKSLAYKGRLATVGYVDGVLSAKIDLELLHAKRLRVFGVSNKVRPLAERAMTVKDFAADIVPQMDKRTLVPVIDRVFAFDQVPAARDFMESNAQVGKIVVKIA